MEEVHQEDEAWLQKEVHEVQQGHCEVEEVHEVQQGSQHYPESDERKRLPWMR
jgi:hypothetical protein